MILRSGLLRIPYFINNAPDSHYACYIQAEILMITNCMDKVMIIELSALVVIPIAGKKVLKILDIPERGMKEGDRVAIWGPSESGKFTLLNALAGLLPATNGAIAVCGHAIGNMSEAQRGSFRI